MNNKDNVQRIGKRWQRYSVIAAFFCFVTAPLSAWAHSPNDSSPNSLRSRIRQSALIAYGQVVDIQYRNSVPTRVQPKGVPHTFVTYKIQDVLRGELDNEVLTLRIPGGADGQGGVFMETTAPAFALGQTDVLFVRGGEIGDCQLVECVEGRFRVHENQVFNGWGVPVVEALKTLQIGGKPRFDLNVMEMPSPSFKALVQRPDLQDDIERLMKETGLSLAELEAKYDQEAPKSTIVDVGYQAKPIRQDVSDAKTALPIKKYRPPLTPEVFFDAVRTLSKEIGPPTTKVVIADANAKFTVPDPRAVALPTKKPPLVDVSEEERLDTIKNGELQ